MTLKIIIMDIDGVLNRTPCVSDGYPRIDLDLARRMNQIIHATGAKVILGTTWREWFHLGWMPLKGWECLLGTHGIKCEVVGALQSGDKAKAFDVWLAGNVVTDWVVIDDRRIHPCQVVTDGHKGLTALDVNEAINIIGRKE